MANVVSGMSPAARAKRKRGFLVWGIIILVIWFASSLGFAAIVAPGAPDFWSAFTAGQVFGFIFFIIGLIFFLIGFSGEIRARAFNAKDTARANELHARLTSFIETPRAELYTATGETQIQDATIIEIERHFDQQTEGAIIGALETSMRMFSTSRSSSSSSSYSRNDDGFGGPVGVKTSSYGTSKTTTSGTMTGTTTADLSLSQTTRANLMGDALFAVFEINREDTFRVVSMSAPGVKAWMADLITSVSEQHGGQMTHAGNVIAAWIPQLTYKFAPHDVSYATDRLKAMVARHYEDREPVSFSGTLIGRNAMLATHIKVGNAEPMEMLPVTFPRAFGNALDPSEPLQEITST